ncbi:MAG: aminomethyl-transferring glycine dehydrogenase subunit GcvPA [Leptospiraceae bacterium]|nr:aminomethyl-transferring glycine dehydrogenase subunit GcvPA [Leptospiraceae bacterium]
MPYIVHSDKVRKELLESLGIKSEDELFAHIPTTLRKDTAQGLATPLDEFALLAEFEKKLASAPTLREHCCGYGLYRHRIPVAVSHLASQREFVTSYTPYQPEVAQGTLQALFEYQSLIALLTGLPVANASLYDGSTALVEAVRMAMRQKNLTAAKVYFSSGVNPRYEEVFHTYFKELSGQSFATVTRLPHDPKTGATVWQAGDPDIVVVQNPHYLGIAEPVCDLKSRYANATVIYLTTEMLSAVILESPRQWGAEIACGEAQSLGLPVHYSGPSLGFLAATKDYLRNMPGRLVGKTTARDAHGEETEAYVITLATREQHIRREKATSNICSNQTLMAIRAAIFMAQLGWQGMQRLVAFSMEKAYYFFSQLKEKKPQVLFFPQGTIFHEVAWRTANADTVVARCMEKGFYPGVRIGENALLSYFHDDFPQELIDFLLEQIITHG